MLLAVFADAVDLHPVICHSKAELARNLFLQFFNLRMNKFDGFSTGMADHVVMMRCFVLLFVPDSSFFEMIGAGEIAFREQFHGPVNCGQPDCRIFVFDKIVQLFHCEMSFGTQKDIQNRFALFGSL